VRIVLPPVAFALASSYDARALPRLATAFVAGSAISAMIAFTDSRYLTSIGPTLTGTPVFDGRGTGLTNHPNVVAMCCVCTLPLAIWQVRAQLGRRRLIAIASLLALLLGLYASRSRSGAGAAVVAGLASLLFLKQYRRQLPVVAFVLTSVVGVLFAIDPSTGSALLHGLRIVGSDTTGSDNARNEVNTQAVHDFLHSPVHGIGLEVADNAHIIYLQAMAVGGLLLLAGYIVYQVGALVRSARLANLHPLALPLFVSALGEIAFNAEQNALTPTVAYLSSGMIAALPLAALVGRGREDE